MSVIDPDGNQTHFTYDTDNRQVTMTDPLGHTTTFTYDAEGHLISTTDRDGRRRDLTYDADGRLVSETWYAPDGTTVLDTLSYCYDADGHLLAAANNAGAYAFSYDGDGRLVSVQEPVGLSLTFGYDPDGNRTLVQDSFGGVLTSIYDADNHLVSRQFGGSGQTPLRIDLTYNADGELATLTRYADLAGTIQVGSSLYAWNAAGQSSSISHQDGSGTTIDQFTYSYDAAGRLTAQTENGVTTAYSYDVSGQLTGDGTSTDSYDPAGNRTNPGDVTGPGNQLLSDGTWTYSYDNEGNLVKKTLVAGGETWTYGYDLRNQMTWAEHRASDGGTLLLRVAYSYDVFGNRIAEWETPGIGPASGTYFAQDGWKVQQDAQGNQPQRVGNENWDVWADLNGNSGTLQTRYLRGDVVDQLFARIGAGGEAAWYDTDRQGSVTDLANGSGQILDHLAYDGFGNAVSQSNPTFGDRYQYDGREWDSATQLVYARGRYEDPITLRWTGEDPRGFAAGDGNLYRVVGNSPTNGTDPAGLELVALSERSAMATQRWLAVHAKIRTMRVKSHLASQYLIVPDGPKEQKTAEAERKDPAWRPGAKWLLQLLASTLDHGTIEYFPKDRSFTIRSHIARKDPKTGKMKTEQFDLQDFRGDDVYVARATREGRMDGTILDLWNLDTKDTLVILCFVNVADILELGNPKKYERATVGTDPTGFAGFTRNMTELAKAIEEGYKKHGKRPFDRIILVGHSGRTELHEHDPSMTIKKRRGPGVGLGEILALPSKETGVKQFDPTAKGTGLKKVVTQRFDVYGLSHDKGASAAIKAIQKTLKPNGILQLAACGFLKTESMGVWREALLEMAKLIKRTVVACPTKMMPDYKAMKFNTHGALFFMTSKDGRRIVFPK